MIKVPFTEAVRMVMESEITHGQSCVLILKAKEYLAEQEGMRDGLRPRIAELKAETQRLRNAKNELERLRQRQQSIESRL